MSGSFRVPSGSATASLRELGSRFFAFVEPAADLAAARSLVERLEKEYPDATHVCFAWRVGWPPSERAADAGKPAGTAGPPILSALRGARLSDVVAAVVRYYGGTNLGKGGLARAYGGVVRAALAGLATVERRPTTRFRLRAPYERLGALHRLMRPGRIERVSESFEAGVELVVDVDLDSQERFLAALAELGLSAEPI